MKSKKFSEMWDLIDRNYCEVDFGSRELLIGLFREETMFQNCHQLHGPATGFGQVEPQIIKDVNSWARKNYSKTLIHISDDASICVTIDVLNMFNSRLSTPRGVLDGYAGTQHRLINGTKVTQWLECENILQNGIMFGAGNTLNGIDSLDTETVIAALKAAEPNHRTAVKGVVVI
jgi:hypothetical protein